MRSNATYTKHLQDKKRLPVPSHRHAAPSAPWPWIDIHDGTWFCGETQCRLQALIRPDLDKIQLESGAPPVPVPCDHSSCDNCWTGYPQSLFPNWTPSQVVRSKISEAVSNYNESVPCRVHYVDVNSDGYFTNAEVLEAPEEKINETWAEIKHPEVSSMSFCLAPKSKCHSPSFHLRFRKHAMS